MPRQQSERLEEEATFRLTTSQKRRLLLAARRAGIPPARLMREAVMSYCDRVIGPDQDPRAALAGIIGAVEAGGASSRQTGEAFTNIVQEKHSRRRRTSG